MSNSKKLTYSELNLQLESIMNELNDEAISVDEAIEKYEKANKIIIELENYLSRAKTKVKKLKIQHKSK